MIEVECKRLCSGFCGVIQVSQNERNRVKEYRESKGFPYLEFQTLSSPNVVRHFVELHTDIHDGCLTACPYLLGNECTIQEVKPLICRLLYEGDFHKCPYGCVPDRYLTKVEANELLRKEGVDWQF